MLYFNEFLVDLMQEQLLDNLDLRRARTTIQYLNEILNTLTHPILLKTTFYFLFGLPEPKRPDFARENFLITETEEDEEEEKADDIFGLNNNNLDDSMGNNTPTNDQVFSPSSLASPGKRRLSRREQHLNLSSFTHASTHNNQFSKENEPLQSTGRSSRFSAASRGNPPGLRSQSLAGNESLLFQNQLGSGQAPLMLLNLNSLSNLDLSILDATSIASIESPSRCRNTYRYNIAKH